MFWKVLFGVTLFVLGFATYALIAQTLMWVSVALCSGIICAATYYILTRKKNERFP